MDKSGQYRCMDCFDGDPVIPKPVDFRPEIFEGTRGNCMFCGCATMLMFDTGENCCERCAFK